MAQDLSQVKGRKSQQDRITNNRDGLLPNRRITDTPTRVVAADMRNASRSDAAARQLEEIFGGVNKAAQDVQGFVDKRHDRLDGEAEAQGALDAATGTVNPELERKYQGYRRAMDVAKAEEGYNTTFAAVRERADAALNDPENPADIEDIDEIVGAGMKEFLFNPDGTRKNLGSPEAYAAIANRYRADSQKLLEQARTKITERTRDEHNGRIVNNIKADVVAGRMNVEETLGKFLPGTDLNEAKALVIQTAFNAADEAEDASPTSTETLKIYDGLLNSKRADGKTPSFSGKELDAIRTARRQAERRIDAKTEEAERELHDKHENALLDRFTQGRDPSIADIRAARGRGEISASFANSVVNRLQAEAEADAREAAAAARRNNDSDDMGAGDELIFMVSEGRISPENAAVAGNDLYRQGGFGSGPGGLKKLAKFRTNLNLFKGLDAGPRKEAFEEIKGWEASTKDRIKRSRIPAAQKRAAVEETTAAAAAMRRNTLTPSRRDLTQLIPAANRALIRRYNLKK